MGNIEIRWVFMDFPAYAQHDHAQGQSAGWRYPNCNLTAAGIDYLIATTHPALAVLHPRYCRSRPRAGALRQSGSARWADRRAPR